MSKAARRLRYWVAGIVLMFVAYSIVLVILLADWQTRGLFGDMFGALNALFSALAFSAVAYSILLQRDALRLQEEDMALTRHEVARTAKLNALATLANTYSESLTWMEQTGKSASALGYVSGLHEEVIRQLEQECGMSKSLYDPT